jgi:shikimate dehydrogenase
MLICAVLGNPVAHSLSPLLHGELAAAVGIELAYLKLLVRSADRLTDFLAALETLGAAGANITVPYKVAVLEHLHVLEPSATAVGAANTVVIDPRRGWVGYNTDGLGAIAAIDSQLRPLRARDQVVVLGAGGAARAVAYEALQRGARVSVLTPFASEVDPFRAALMVPGDERIRVEALNDESLLEQLIQADFLVNATPLGMTPDVGSSAVSTRLVEELSRSRNMSTLHVLDAVYNPVQTRFLREFETSGARTCSGLWMLIHQALAAFQLFSGRSAGGVDLTRLYTLLEVKASRA